MTTEHKILTLIDRGVSCVDDIGNILDGANVANGAFWGLIHAGRIGQIAGRRDFFALTPLGLLWLDHLDSEA